MLINIPPYKMEYDIETTMSDFYISLPGNYTTGYQWKVVDIEKSKLKYLKTDYTPISNQLGSQGMARLYFRPLKRGNTILKLSYQRSWEKNGNIDTYYIRIK